MLGATRYPFMALVAYHESRMKVIHRFLGVCPPEECIDVFVRVANQMDPAYVAIRSERLSFKLMVRTARDAGRSIREQQDAAYQLSLQADREKADLMKKEQEEKLKVERSELLAIQEKDRKIQVCFTFKLI
jgi:FAS-associated factor 2